jgi:hypothetical protein
MRSSRRGLTVLLVPLVLLAGPIASAEKPKLIVLELAVAGGADKTVASAFGEALATTLATRGLFDVVSARDVETLLGAERQRQLVGCSDTSCMTELTGALGARFLLTGTLARLGDAWQLTLTTLDSEKAQPLGRSTRLAGSLEQLRAVLPWALAEATATPAPPEPSKLVPITCLSLGAAALIGGGVAGLQGMTSDAALTQELANTRPGSLDTLASYQQKAKQPALLKTAAVAALAAGAVLLGAGILTWPSSGGGGAVALLPSGDGVAIAGVFP